MIRGVRSVGPLLPPYGYHTAGEGVRRRGRVRVSRKRRDEAPLRKAGLHGSHRTAHAGSVRAQKKP
jgi:hypothetical protein